MASGSPTSQLLRNTQPLTAVLRPNFMIDRSWANTVCLPLKQCDLCHQRKVRCDRKFPCDRCNESFVQCLRTRIVKRTRRKRRPGHQRLQPSDTSVPQSTFSQVAGAAHGLDHAVQHDHSIQQSTVESNLPQHVRVPSDHPPVVSEGQSVSSLISEQNDSTGLLVVTDTNQQVTEQQPTQQNLSLLAGESRQELRQVHTTSQSGLSLDSPIPRYQIGAIYEARTHILSELQGNRGLNSEQREVFDLAILSASRIPLVRSRSVSVHDAFVTESVDFYDPVMYPSTEAMCFLLGGYRTVTASFHSELVSFISKRTFERMAYALIDQKVQGYTRVQYVVCVNFLALTSTAGLRVEGQTVFLQEQIKNLQDRYRENAFTALSHISVLDPPCLPLLQALLAGAMLFQLAGRIEKCAQLSAAACIVCTQLGGRYFASLASGASREDSLEARQSIGHCYILDKALAMTLGRRSLLPEMEVNVAVLIPPTADMPCSPIFNIYLEFAKVQDSIANTSRTQHTLALSERKEILRSLRSRMAEITLKVREFRLQSPHTSEHLLQGEWMGVDFTYFTIMTSIIRLDPNIFIDCNVRDDCLENARHALFELRRLEEHGLISQEYHNAYCISVAWIILVYPMCSFFTIFCNVVVTSDKSDFRLLEAVTDGLSMFAEYNTSVGNLQKLCGMLVSLCRIHIDDLGNVD
ncbi:putative Zn(2)-C6 fungal-type domain-containing protein [Seiridium cardinale]